MEKESRGFTNEHTNMVKGFAVIMLLFYHIMYYDAGKNYVFLYSCWLEEKIAAFFGTMGWRCVEIFTILSGYGLVKSADKYKEKVNSRFSARHIMKLLFAFWFVFIVFVPLGFLFNKNPLHVYGMDASGMVNFICDFLGMSWFAGLPTMNETWWYMGEILKLYFFFPVMYYGVKNNTFIMVVFWILASLFGGFRMEKAFILGMLLSEKDIMTKYMRMSFLKKTLVVVCIGLVTRIQLYNGNVGMPMVFFIILGIVWAIRARSVFGKGLAFLGKHSGNIFMFHSFIYLYYFEDFIYGLRYPMLIFTVLLGICVGTSIVLEGFKKIVRYGKMEEYFKQKCTSFRLGDIIKFKQRVDEK